MARKPKKRPIDSNGNFIGYSQLARKEARKRTRHFEPNAFVPKDNSKSHIEKKRIPKRWKIFEQFFASILMSSRKLIENSHCNTEARLCLLSEICQRLALPLPSKLTSYCKTKKEFYSSRGSLVMEESRAILADALVKCKKSKKNLPSLRLRLTSSEMKEKQPILVLGFQKMSFNLNSCNQGKRHIDTSNENSDEFTKSESYDMKPGGCFLIFPQSYPEKNSDEWPVIASFQSSTETELTLLVFRHEIFQQICDLVEDDICDNIWFAQPLTTLTSQIRQFEVLVIRQPQVNFMSKLLGHEIRGTHIKFTSDSENEEVIRDEDKYSHKIEDHDTNKMFDMKTLQEFSLPVLNPSQYKGIKDFCFNSELSALSLVQGPPGTGKTTFLVSLIFHCIFSIQNEDKRILVTAPTNKAVLVLINRFFDIWNNDSRINVVLIGVEDKLIVSSEEEIGAGDYDVTNDSRLKGIFVYKWLDEMIENFTEIQNSLDRKEHNTCLVSKLNFLIQKVEYSIPSCAMGSGFIKCVGSMKTTDEQPHQKDMCNSLKSLIVCLRNIDATQCMEELLSTANVIFCTLSTCGISLMKRSKQIDYLLIDEAAAATEGECCIPFLLRPKKLLAVGDPKQLPATIISEYAKDLGLDKSMHHRLMYECNMKYIMLDVQYRMKPDISAFPSMQFYDGKISNGLNVQSQEYVGKCSILDGKHYSFMHVDGGEELSSYGSYFNVHEGHAVVGLIIQLRDMHAAIHVKQACTPWNAPDKIRIITFYSGQVTLIQNLLKKAKIRGVLVATVDSSQGCEADIVIVSFVRSRESTQKHTIGFLKDERRINVAITRARYQLVCVGNAYGTLYREEKGAIKKLIQNAMERDCISSERNKERKNISAARNDHYQPPPRYHREIVPHHDYRYHRNPNHTQLHQQQSENSSSSSLPPSPPPRTHQKQRQPQQEAQKVPPSNDNENNHNINKKKQQEKKLFLLQKQQELLSNQITLSKKLLPKLNDTQEKSTLLEKIKSLQLKCNELKKESYDIVSKHAASSSN